MSWSNIPCGELDGGIIVAFFSLEDCSVRAFLTFGGPATTKTISKSTLLQSPKSVSKCVTNDVDSIV